MNILKMAQNAPQGEKTFYQSISDLSLTTNLRLCLDAGDSASYNPSTQTDKWLDTSGNGFDFFRGSGTGSDAADPTFNGTAGQLSVNEYWSFDGGDYFTYDTTNETWMNNLHKNNAVFSLVAVFYRDTSSDLIRFFSTGSSLTAVGCRMLVGATGIVNFIIGNGSASQAVIQSTTAVSTGWTVVGISYNESTGNWITLINGTINTGTQTFTSPSTSNASMTARIGVQVGTTSPNSVNTRQSLQAMWEGTALTQQNLTDIYDAIKGRFGL